MTETSAGPGSSLLERRFRFTERGTTLWRDTVAGATTFVVMSYIIFVNPQILTFAGVEVPPGTDTLPFDGVLAVTCLVAGVMTIAMGLYTNYAYAIAPGLGINATVAFGLVAGEGLGYPAAMGLIVVEGIAVTIFVVTGLREKVMDAIPLDLKKVIAIGIGLFIAFIGFESAGFVVQGVPLVDFAPFTTWPIFVAFFGLLLTVALRARGVPGDLLIGIVATTILATIVNEASGEDAGFTAGATIPDDVYDNPDLSLLGEFSLSAFGDLAIISAIVWAFSLFMADFFDTMGTLVGVGRPAGYLDEEGRLPEIRKPLLVDSLAAVAGGAASTSSATTYIESASGVSVGGRTGWVSVVCGALFLPFMFFAPIIGMVPPEATTPALIVVGFLMMTALTEAEEIAEAEQIAEREGGPPPPVRPARKLAGIDFSDLAIGLAAALTIMVMPFTFSIADGIGFGFIAYVVICLARGEARRVHPFMYLAAGAFALYFLVPLLQDHLSWV